MARFAIQHEPTKRWVQEDESGVFLQEDDNYLFSYKTKDLAQKAIDEHYKVYYTTIDSDNFETEDGAYPFDEFIVINIENDELKNEGNDIVSCLVKIDAQKDGTGKDEAYCNWYDCPQCKNGNIMFKDNYCSGCGCRFEWSGHR